LMGSPQIFVMNADGSNVTQLTNNNNDNQYPTWGPLNSALKLAISVSAAHT